MSAQYTRHSESRRAGKESHHSRVNETLPLRLRSGLKALFAQGDYQVILLDALNKFRLAGNSYRSDRQIAHFILLGRKVQLRSIHYPVPFQRPAGIGTHPSHYRR